MNHSTLRNDFPLFHHNLLQRKRQDQQVSMIHLAQFFDTAAPGRMQDDDFFPGIVFGSFGGTLFVVYAVLWAVIPEAKSASEKLEMRGEKVDLNTIKNTIQEDLEGFKSRAEKCKKFAWCIRYSIDG